MQFLMSLLLVVQILSALAMIGLVLIQHGKGADAGASFGGGSSASGSLFGATGSANFLSRTTAVLATVFFVATLTLAYFGNPGSGAEAGEGVLERVGPAASAAADAIPGAAPTPLPQAPQASAAAAAVPAPEAAPAPAASAAGPAASR